MHATNAADRQVDTFRKDCEHNAKGHDTLDCLTGEQCQQVIHREKAGLCDTHNDDQHDQYQPD